MKNFKKGLKMHGKLLYYDALYYYYGFNVVFLFLVQWRRKNRFDDSESGNIAGQNNSAYKRMLAPIDDED